MNLMTKMTYNILHIKTKLFINLMLLISWSATAQLSDFTYERSLTGVSEDWHSIALPDQVYGKLKPSLDDLRIYGITENLDTTEVPYILKVNDEKFAIRKHFGQIINKSRSDVGFYYTVELNQPSQINSLKLKFTDSNFDWKVNLEGSLNQQEWFTILENSRILDIQNASTEYSFTDLNFPTSNYHYYRILIKSNKQPTLSSIDIFLEEKTEGVLLDYDVVKWNIKENNQIKTSEIEFELENPVPVNSLKINVATTYDYFRPVSIQYLIDSVKTEKGFLYNYTTIKRTTLSSLEENQFDFKNTIASKFKIIVYNGDNQSLDIKSVDVKGFKYELIARFMDSANYKLVYGNKSARQPHYDIHNFKNNIPVNLKALEVGTENQIIAKDTPSSTALFENEFWLWAIMGIIIVLLGGFTYKMLGTDKASG